MSRKDDLMTCEDYKKALTSEPGFVDESRHADQCDSCHAYRDAVLALDARIAAAMELRVPELTMPKLAAENVDANNVVSMVKRRSVSKPAWFALAATVLLATAFGIRIAGVGTVHETLEDQVLAHLDHEPGALRVESTPVSAAQLLRVVPNDVATMDHDVGLITYARSCEINGNTIPHLVIQGKRGPITLLLMPEETVSETKTLDGVGIRGVILPVGDGSIAIIGDREENLDRIRENVLDSVTWNTST